MQKPIFKASDELTEDEKQARRLRINAPITGNLYDLLKLHTASAAPENPHHCGYWNAAAGCFQVSIPVPAPV